MTLLTVFKTWVKRRLLSRDGAVSSTDPLGALFFFFSSDELMSRPSERLTPFLRHVSARDQSLIFRWDWGSAPIPVCLTQSECFVFFLSEWVSLTSESLCAALRSLRRCWDLIRALADEAQHSLRQGCPYHPVEKFPMWCLTAGLRKEEFCTRMYWKAWLETAIISKTVQKADLRWRYLNTCHVRIMFSKQRRAHGFFFCLNKAWRLARILMVSGANTKWSCFGNGNGKDRLRGSFHIKAKRTLMSPQLKGRSGGMEMEWSSYVASHVGSKYE